LNCDGEHLPKHHGKAGGLSLFKAGSTLHLSPAVVRELGMALSRRKKRAALPVGSRGTTSVDGAGASQRTSRQLAGKRKANELVSSGEFFDPANRRPAPDDGSAPLLAKSRVKKLLSAAGKSGLQREARRTRLFWPGPTSRLSQVGCSSPQTWIQNCLNPLSHLRQPIGTCLSTYLGL
jgi:hypothetical protein